MIVVRWLGAAARRFAGLFTGIAAGVACVVLALIVAGVASLPAPDPVTRFTLAVVSEPEVDTAPSLYQPVRDWPSRVWPPVAASDLAPNYLATRYLAPWYVALLAAPTGSIAPKPVAPDQAVVPAAPASPSGDAGAARREQDDLGAASFRHFLQGGYFAERDNAMALSGRLAAAGLGVVVEQRVNGAGRPRWLVLIGPYRRKQDALGARRVAPGLLAEAFHVEEAGGASGQARIVERLSRR